MAWPTNKQAGKEMASLSSLKEQRELSPSSFCFRRWMCDLQQRNKEQMIFIAMVSS